jgi:ribosome biogenesis protein BMS1
MGVLTHLDAFKDNKRLKKTKKALKHRFWAEIYQGECLIWFTTLFNLPMAGHRSITLGQRLSVSESLI